MGLLYCALFLLCFLFSFLLLRGRVEEYIENTGTCSNEREQRGHRVEPRAMKEGIHQKIRSVATDVSLP